MYRDPLARPVDGVLVNFSSETFGRWFNGWGRGAWQACDDYEEQYRQCCQVRGFTAQLGLF